MGQRRDQEPKVAPVDRDPGQHPRRRRSGVGPFVGLLAAVAVIALVVGTGREENHGTSTTTLANTPDVTRASTTTPDDPPLVADLLSGSLGPRAGLYVAVGQEDVGLTVYSSRGERRLEIPLARRPSLQSDRSGSRLAFLGHCCGTPGESALYVDLGGMYSLVRRNVSSVRWHATSPGQIAWMEGDDDPQICRADAADPATFGRPRCVASRGGSLVGYDTSGFLVADTASDVIERLDERGELVASIPGDDAIIGRDQRVLVVGEDPDSATSTFTLTDRNLGRGRLLDWAPERAVGVYGKVAWSPAPSRLAFLTSFVGRIYRLEIFTLDGDQVASVYLSGRVWDVGWDSTGRYVLAPGVAYERDDRLNVYDTVTGRLQVIHFDDWVQQADLVTAS